MATIGQQLLAPESGWRRYDDTIGLIGFSGAWGTDTNTAYYKGSYRGSNVIGSTANVCFYGTKIRFIADYYTNKPTSIDIDIDGETESFSLYSTVSGGITQVLAYEKTGLSLGYHKVTITVKQDTVWTTLDAIDIDADGELIRYDYFENEHLPEPMRKYGVAWFGFDELSGNALDKLGGNYVGNVVGATRVTGWNGKGNAMSFNGNQFCQINSNFASDEITYRFKIKKETSTFLGAYYSSIFDTNGRSVQSTGLFADINANKSVRYSMSIGTSSVFMIEGNKDVVDGNWHEIILNYKNNGNAELYIDGELDKRHRLLMGTPISHIYNVTTIGRLGSSNLGHLNGQIDDFQIYSKALSPSDFAQQRVAIKTSDNKVLVLSPSSSRVKELPNLTNQSMMNETYEIREIDNSVDNPPINLLNPTNEYELFGIKSSQIENGKLIEIPLSTNFKTIKVENNN